MDEYRLFPLNPHYRIWSDGRIESCPTRGRRGGPTDRWRPIKLRVDQRGYRRFTARIDGKSRPIGIHRAVLLSFVGPCPSGMHCRYLDGDPGNNALANLCWETPLENADDKYRHGTQRFGERHWKSKLTDAQRAAIRAEYATLRTSMKKMGRGMASPKPISVSSSAAGSHDGRRGPSRGRERRVGV